MQAFNLSMFEVARRAGLSHSTLSRGLRSTGWNWEQKTVEAVSAVLIAEENRLRAVMDGEKVA